MTLSTCLDPSPEQATRLAEIRESVFLLHRITLNYLSSSGRLTWPEALAGCPAPARSRAVTPALPVGALLKAFHTLRADLAWAQAAPQSAYDAAIRAAVRAPAAPCPLRLDDAVHLIDPVTVLIAPLGSEARVLGRPYLLPSDFWAALVRDGRRRYDRLEVRRAAAESAWLAGQGDAGPQLLALQARCALQRPGLAWPDLPQTGTVRVPAATLEQRDGAWPGFYLDARSGIRS